MEITFKIGLVILILLAVVVSVSVTNAQSNNDPCSSPEASQFDFWLGEWALKWKDTDGKDRNGKNVITKTLGGCVIEENFTAGDNSLIGRSLSVYNPVKKVWQQTWVDNNGAYMEFTGGKDNENMYLQRKVLNKQGKEIIQKMTFTDITNDSFKWLWESSSDGGAVWSLIWEIRYTRMK